MSSIKAEHNWSWAPMNCNTNAPFNIWAQLSLSTSEFKHHFLSAFNHCTLGSLDSIANSKGRKLVLVPLELVLTLRLMYVDNFCLTASDFNTVFAKCFTNFFSLFIVSQFNLILNIFSTFLLLFLHYLLYDPRPPWWYFLFVAICFAICCCFQQYTFIFWRKYTKMSIPCFFFKLLFSYIFSFFLLLLIYDLLFFLLSLSFPYFLLVYCTFPF